MHSVGRDAHLTPPPPWPMKRRSCWQSYAHLSGRIRRSLKTEGSCRCILFVTRTKATARDIPNPASRTRHGGEKEAVSGILGTGRTGNSPLSPGPFFGHFTSEIPPTHPAPLSAVGDLPFANFIGGIPDGNLNIRRIELPRAQFGNSMDLRKRERKKERKEFLKELVRTDLVDKAGEKKKGKKKRRKKENLCWVNFRCNWLCRTPLKTPPVLNRRIVILDSSLGLAQPGRGCRKAGVHGVPSTPCSFLFFSFLFPLFLSSGVLISQPCNSGSTFAAQFPGVHVTAQASCMIFYICRLLSTYIVHRTVYAHHAMALIIVALESKGIVGKIPSFSFLLSFSILSNLPRHPRGNEKFRHWTGTLKRVTSSFFWGGRDGEKSRSDKDYLCVTVGLLSGQVWSRSGPSSSGRLSSEGQTVAGSAGHWARACACAWLARHLETP